MPSNVIVGDREEAAMRAHRALDPRLLADALHPFVRARWRVARLAGLPALESSWLHVLAAAEE